MFLVEHDATSSEHPVTSVSHVIFTSDDSLWWETGQEEFCMKSETKDF